MKTTDITGGKYINYLRILFSVLYIAALQKHTRIPDAAADKRTGESIIILNRSQAEALIGLEWRSIHADMRYMPFYDWLAYYSLVLAFPVTCEQSIIGKACYLES